MKQQDLDQEKDLKESLKFENRTLVNIFKHKTGELE